MTTLVASSHEISLRVLNHLLRRLERTPALDGPFSHIYLEEVLPHDLYEQLLSHLPDSSKYIGSSEKYHNDGAGTFVRLMLPLTVERIADLTTDQHEFWSGLAAALTTPELKRAVFAKLSKDLAFRYGVSEAQVGALTGYSRPTLYRETAGFEIPPHPDTRRKIVTMHLYCPADRSQLGLGTALYRRKLLGWPFGSWQNRFETVKQFVFQPNSAYAFVVNNTISRKSWHGREKLPEGSGVRNTLLNTFYETPGVGYTGYLAKQAA